MASLSFGYRSKKPIAPLEARLSFRIEVNPNPISFYARSQITVEKDYWKRHGKKSKDISIQNRQSSINKQITDLRTFVLGKFQAEPIENVNKHWLANAIDLYYNPPKSKPKTEIPRDLIGYIDYYLEQRKHETPERAKRRTRVTKHKMERLQKELGRTILIHEIDEGFKNAYVNFCTQNQYSPNTQHREFALVKTICFHARYNGLETHHQLDKLVLKKIEVEHVYLTPGEIDLIRDLELPNEHLENSRDWLLISCYTGQRVSDFMRFAPDMIRIENGKHLLEFRQKKTGKLMTIPFVKEARELLKKRNGKFPRSISGQRYNDYIKDVCRIAGLDNEVQGKKRICIAEDGAKPTRNDYRDVLGKFQKWELVTSHIGRRSFATNHYGKVPTTHLINFTGHSTEKMFLNYIKKSNKDLAIDAYDYFE